jgi:hypothetical protein
MELAMTEEHPTPAIPGRVSKTTAARILQKAADLDAIGDEMIELQELRLAAKDAGISTRSFDMSLAELRKQTTPPPLPTSAQKPGVSQMAVVGAGTLAGTLTIGLVSLLTGGAPEEAILGAIIGGGGAMAGIVVYLRTAFRAGASPSESDRS